MDDLSTIRVQDEELEQLRQRSVRLSIVLIATPVRAAHGTTYMVGSRHIVERVVGEGEHDGQMSRRHATVRRRGDKLLLRDGAEREDGGWKLSANGVHGPDGQAIGDDEVPLQRGDTFRTGKSLWVVIHDMEGLDDPKSSLKGYSPAMQKLREQVAVVVSMVASRLKQGERVQQSLLVTGPRGSGKQVVAQEAHRLLSIALANPKTPMRQVAAPSLGDGTVTADLFGVTDGYATGTRARAGYFEQADKGILLLDEVGDTPAGAQARLLNALQERQVTPLGGSRAVPFDCLVVSATNRELGSNLRADLIDRLARFKARIPPLAERIEDIPVILDALRQRHGVAHTLPASLVHEMMTRPWPGNVRELDNVMERLVALATYRGEPVSRALLRRVLDEDEPPAGAQGSATVPPTRVPSSSAKRPSADELRGALRAAGGNKSEVARFYGRDPRQIRRWMKMYDIEDSTPQES